MRARAIKKVCEDAVLYQYLDSLLTETDTVNTENMHEERGSGTRPEMADAHASRLPEINTSSEPDTRSDPVQSDSPAMIFSAKDSRAAIFHINKTKIALPARFISAIIDNDSKLNITRHITENSYGSLTYRGHCYRLLDVAPLLHDDQVAQPASDYQTVILLEPGHWGIVCHDFDSIKPLDIGKIKWRVDRKSRVCIAGVDIAEMCLIFDIDAVKKLLKTKT